MKKLKTPCFNFYPESFLGGIRKMTDKEVGIYIKALCYRFNEGAIDEEEYQAFTQGCLYLTLSIGGQSIGATVVALDQQHLFLLHKLFEKNKEKAKAVPYGFKVKKVMLLGNVADTYIKGFAINITTPMLTPEFRESLVALIRKNKGNVPLSMYLFDPEKKWNIEFLSRKFRVAVTASFIQELEKLRVRYTVLKK